MKYIAAYLLLKCGGNDAPSADDVSKVLAAAGVTADKAVLTNVVAGFEGKDIKELMDSASDRIFVGGGGGGGGGGGAAAGGDAAAPVEEKKEEEEVDFAGGMDMFGGGGGGGDY
jgi:ribosomal protein L12E/L44/L45/RPP1/RPP2